MERVRIVRKLLKTTFFMLVITIGLLTLVTIISSINNKIKLNKESKQFKPTGKMIEVNKHKMHVYSEGEGKNTLVFMAGGGTSSPYLDFKTLYSKLSNKYRIIVVEKAGYGFSEVAKVSRDIDVILEETRMALKEAGYRGPYILMPHSMSGLEAIYWAQKYPDEVQGIIGLDPAIPEAYESLKIPSSFLLNLLKFAGGIGITRFIPSICESSSAISHGNLSEEEKEVYRAMFYKSTMTSNMVEEMKQVKENAKKVNQGGVPTKIPMYFFISNGKEIGVDNWVDLLSSYCSKSDNGKSMYLGCEHYVHNYESGIIAEESNRFIKEIIKE